MSAGSFDSSGGSSGDGGTRRRIAHAAAGNNADLMESLNFKRESMGKLLNNVGKHPATQKKELFPMFVKKPKINNDFENDKSIKNVKTFCGKPFMVAVASSNAQKKDSNKVVIHSDSDANDDSWLTKPKMINGMLTQAGKKLPLKAIDTRFKVKRRAILSDDDEDYSDNDDGKDSRDEDGESLTNGKTSKRRKANGTTAKAKTMAKKKAHQKKADESFVITKKKSKRKHEISTGSEDFIAEDDEEGENSMEMDDETGEESLSDEEEVAKTPSSSELSDEENELNPKKSLKELKAKAKRVRQKQKRRGGDEAPTLLALSDASEEDGDAAAARDSEDPSGEFDSEDSDAGERRDKRAIRQRQVLENRCLDFVNAASEEELNKTEKFNARLVSMFVEKRPFGSFAQMADEAASVSRGAAMLASYVDFLANRSILDQVLDDCKKQAEHIKLELDRLESGQKFNTQPKLLSSDCSLHSYQQVGLQWLIMMNKLGLNAILADEMGLGKTIQIIAFLAWTKEQPKMQFPHLIVVPSSTLENWMNEIAKWCPSLRLLTYYGSIQDRAQLRYKASSKNVDVILTTYNMIISRAEDRSFFKKFAINYVIYDEGHMLRSCNTMRYKNLMRVQGKRKILLTGTPLQNNLVELISLLFFTMTKLFTKYCDDINALLQMFVRKGNALQTRGKGRGGVGGAKRGGAIKRRAPFDNDNEDEQQNGVAEEAEDENDVNTPLYEQHKIAQAKSILHPFVLRRLKTNVLNSLPKKYERVEVCDVTPLQDDLYNEILEDFHEAKILGNANPLGSMMQMRQVANHPLLYRRNFDDAKVREIARILCSKESKYKGKKMEYVAEDLAYMSDIQIHQLCRKFSSLRRFELDEKLALDSGKCKLLDKILPKIFGQGEKVLVFSQFAMMLDVLELYLAYHDHKFCRLDGSTPVMERQELINQFNADSSIKVFLLSTKAGGLGINLTAANHIIIHDIDMNPYNDKQAEDRCHRMGQTREVHVTRLISRNTIEESMLELAKKKLELERHVTSAHTKNNGKDQELDSKTVEELLTRAIDSRQK